MKAHISAGNSKLGAAIPKISFVPVASCPENVPCSGDCYAMKAYRQYPGTRTVWEENFDLAKADPKEFFRQVSAWLEKKKKKPEFFRLHVAGDIFSDEYMAELCLFVAQWPAIKFLAFTKQHARAVEFKIRGMVPNNLTLILSGWPGLEMPADRAGLRVAWMQNGLETRVPDNAIHCPGNCESCGMCWQLPAIGRDVVFNKH